MTQPPPPAFKCPVCGAGFRSSAACSRCGTDLRPLMRVALKAWHARRRARHALHAGDLPSAMRWSALAWQLHHTGRPPVFLRNNSFSQSPRATPAHPNP